MALTADQTGVCVIRAWASSNGPVFRVRLRTDVEDSGTEQVFLVTDVEAAVGIVSDYLLALARPDDVAG